MSDELLEEEFWSRVNNAVKTVKFTHITLMQLNKCDFIFLMGIHNNLNALITLK